MLRFWWQRAFVVPLSFLIHQKAFQLKKSAITALVVVVVLDLGGLS